MSFFDSTDIEGRIGEAIGSVIAVAICALIAYVTIATVLHW